jgi:hypothetical protein
MLVFFNIFQCEVRKMVMSPKFYQQQIVDVGIEGLEIAPRSLADAMALKIKLRKDQRILQHIRFNLRMDVRSIRREYLDKLKSLKEPSKKMVVFNKKLTEKEVRKAKKALTEERDDKIAPYDALDRLVEYYLAEIDNSKVYINSFMEKGA